MPVGADRCRHVVVVEFADAADEVARPAECLRQAHMLRNRLPEDLRVGEDPGRVRIEPGQERVAARATERKCAVRPLEPHTPPRQPVDIRRLGQRIAVAAQECVEVVGDDEEHVGPISGRGRQADVGNRRTVNRTQHDSQRMQRHQMSPVKDQTGSVAAYGTVCEPTPGSPERQRRGWL